MTFFERTEINIHPVQPGRSATALALTACLSVAQLNRAVAGEGSFEYRYENYAEDNDRILVETHVGAFDVSLRPWLSLKGEVIYDGISGATPDGAPTFAQVDPLHHAGKNKVRLSNLVDVRYAENVATVFLFGRHRLGVTGPQLCDRRLQRPLEQSDLGRHRLLHRGEGRPIGRTRTGRPALAPHKPGGAKERQADQQSEGEAGRIHQRCPLIGRILTGSAADRTSVRVLFWYHTPAKAHRQAEHPSAWRAGARHAVGCADGCAASGTRSDR